MMINDYWFLLKPSVYVKFGSTNNLLLYNTENGENVETEIKEIISLVTEIYKPENSGVALLSRNIYNIPQVHEVISLITGNGMGVLLSVAEVPEKPVNLVPILNLQRDVERLDKNSIGEDVKNYLLELNLYINSTCSQHCKLCADYCKQARCCTANNTGAELPAQVVENILRQIKYSSVNRINISGGNIFDHKEFGNITELLLPFKDIVYFRFHYKNYIKSDSIAEWKQNLIVTFPLNEKIFAEALSKVDRTKASVNFIIENEDMYYKADDLIEKHNITQYEITPFFTGNNLDFFENNVFVNRDDIFSTPLKMREIFRNQKLNSNFFGVLYILSDGTAKADINAKPIGNICNTPLLDVLCNEMIENTAWRRIRASEPCNSCLYQFICPPTSNYEVIINKSNLCTIRV